VDNDEVRSSTGRLFHVADVYIVSSSVNGGCSKMI